MMKRYNLSSFQVDLFSLFYMFLYPITNFPSSYIIDNVSLKLGLSIAAICTMLSAGLKIFFNHSIYYAYGGQFLVAACQPLILSNAGKMATLWFEPRNRVIVTGVCIFSNTLGIIFGYFFPSIFLKSSDSNEEFRSQLTIYLIGLFVVNVILCLPTLIFQRSKPSQPSSQSQRVEILSFKKGIKTVFKQPNFIIMLIFYSFMVGYFNFYGTKINAIMSKYNHISFLQSSIIFGTSSASGIIATIIISIYLDKTKLYKRVFLILTISSLIFQVLMTILPEFYENYAFVIFLVFYNLVQICIIPIYGISLDYVIELTFPVGESISGGILNLFAQITAIIAIFLTEYFQNNNFPRSVGNIIGIAMILIALISFIFLKENLLRKAGEVKKKKKNKEVVVLDNDL